MWRHSNIVVFFFLVFTVWVLSHASNTFETHSESFSKITSYCLEIGWQTETKYISLVRLPANNVTNSPIIFAPSSWFHYHSLAKLSIFLSLFVRFYVTTRQAPNIEITKLQMWQLIRHHHDKLSNEISESAKAFIFIEKWKLIKIPRRIRSTLFKSNQFIDAICHIICRYFKWKWRCFLLKK